MFTKKRSFLGVDLLAKLPRVEEEAVGKFDGFASGLTDSTTKTLSVDFLPNTKFSL